MLFAMGVPHDVVQVPGGVILVVPPKWEAGARRQLELYAQEDAGFRPHRPEFEFKGDGLYGVLAYIALLGIAYAMQVNSSFGLDWRRQGLSSARDFLDEPWRALTSLTLHADIEHLCGNLFFGALFGVLVTQLIGSGAGWLMILLAGFGGNAVNALVQPETHRSLGASTAVFGALGLLVGFEFMRRKKFELPAVQRWAPPILGAFLLGWLGFGGGDTDVMAHVFGFLVGGALGLPLAKLDARGSFDLPEVQTWCGMATIALLCMGWSFAHL